MEARELLDLFQGHPVVQEIVNRLRKQTRAKIKLENGIGSLVAFIAAAVGREMKGLQLFVLNDKEEAAYFYNDLLTFYDEENVRCSCLPRFGVPVILKIKITIQSWFGQRC